MLRRVARRVPLRRARYGGVVARAGGHAAARRNERLVQTECSWLNRSRELWHDGAMTSETAPAGTPPTRPPEGAELATPVTRGQIARVGLILLVTFLVGALLLRLQADRIRELDLPLPAGWVAVSADTVLAGISPQSAVRAARSADAPVGATPRVRLITLSSGGTDAPNLKGTFWLIVTDDIRPSMEIPAGDAMDVIRAYVLIDQAGRVALAVERGFADTDPTLPPD